MKTKKKIPSRWPPLSSLYTKNRQELDKLIELDPFYPDFYISRFNHFVRNVVKLSSLEISFICNKGNKIWSDFVEDLSNKLDYLEKERESIGVIPGLNNAVYDLQKAKELLVIGNIFFLVCGKKIDNHHEVDTPSNSLHYTIRASAFHTKRSGEDFPNNVLSDCTTAIELNPYNSDAYRIRNVVYKSKGEYELAVNDLSSILKFIPNDASSFADRGAIRSKQGHYEIAIYDYTKSIEILPKFHTLWRNRSVCYYKFRKMELALADINRALQLKWDISFLHIRARVFMRIGRIDCAIKDMTELIDNSKEMEVILIHVLRGRCYMIKEFFEEAIVDFSKARALGSHLGEFGRKEAVKKLIEKIMKL